MFSSTMLLQATGVRKLGSEKLSDSMKATQQRACVKASVCQSQRPVGGGGSGGGREQWRREGDKEGGIPPPAMQRILKENNVKRAWSHQAGGQLKCRPPAFWPGVPGALDKSCVTGKLVLNHFLKHK